MAVAGVRRCPAVLVVVVLLLQLTVLFLSVPPTTTEAAPDPHFCCRRGRWAAAGLGFIGGFAVGRRRGGCWGCGGCGGCGGGCGWCGGGGWYGRRRRSLDQVMDHHLLDDLYWKIASKDLDGCGRRLVCELAQKDPHYLTDNEIQILLPFRGRDESDETTYYGQYDKAVWHGQLGHPCHDLYPLCDVPATEIMPDYRTNFTLHDLNNGE